MTHPRVGHCAATHVQLHSIQNIFLPNIRTYIDHTTHGSLKVICAKFTGPRFPEISYLSSETQIVSCNYT